MSRRRCDLPLSLLVLVWGCWSAPRPTAPHREPQLGIQVSSSRLDNGLRVVLVPDPRATDITVTMRYQVGEIDDPAGREGMAHLVEHLLYEPVIDGVSLFDRLHRTALAFNGQTTRDATTYTARGDASQLAALLEIEAARLDQRCASIPEAAFLRQREVVRNELRERGDHDRIMVTLDQGVFPVGHPYHRAGAATIDTLSTITRDEACAFADAHYTPANAVLVVGGNYGTSALGDVLARTLLPIRRTASARRPIPPPVSRQRVTSQVPVDDPVVVIVWPLPDDPVQRARIRAIVRIAASLVDSRVNGLVRRIDLGGGRARLTGFSIQLARGVTTSDALSGVGHAISGMSEWFGSGLFEAGRERAVFELFSTFEPGLDRDIRLADEALLGRDVAAGIQAEIDGLRRFGRDDAVDLAARLDLPSATIVVLQPETAVRRNVGRALEAPIHDVSRRVVDDPAEAYKAAKPIGGRNVLAGVRTRVLANGMSVVLLPLSSVHTVDVRIVFPIGTGDEPGSQRGVAMLAGHALRSDSGDGPEMLRFWMAGGAVEVEVDLHQTAFIARGLDTHLDLQLTGLGRMLRAGIYNSLRESIDHMRLFTETRDDALATVAWRTALYGEHHPYVAAGDRSRAIGLDIEEVRAFQRANYVPDGAMLIIAGGFDPAVAERWIDYVFGDWRGGRTAARLTPATLRALPFAQYQDSSQLSLRIALPAFGSNRAVALVVTEMVAEAMTAVREQLAASYGLSAVLLESRALTAILISGSVDPQRATDALAMLRDELARLRVLNDDTAARFVAARRRVMNRLASVDTNAGALADRVQHAAALGRLVGADLETAEAVRSLKLEQVGTLLAKLDVENTAMLLRGPTDAVTKAYAAIGRRAVLLN